MKITRREFFTKTIQGAAIMAVPAVLGSVLESCNQANPSIPSTAAGLATINVTSNNNTIVLDINSSSPLANVGSAALVQFQNGALLVDRPVKDSFNALSSICTHQGCTVSEYDGPSQQFICPCHGSRFSSSGQVTQGPAGTPLTSYQTQFSNNQLIIKI